MSEGSDEVKRWTARRNAAVVFDIIKGKTTAAEAARSNDLTVAEVGSWRKGFFDRALRPSEPSPWDVEAQHLAEKMELLAKIGELAMEKEIWTLTSKRASPCGPCSNPTASNALTRPSTSKPQTKTTNRNAKQPY
ncbi:DUF1153 domain-containing protein [bacterium]|nr:DUF1153 domain-containing protein [bacterium]